VHCVNRNRIKIATLKRKRGRERERARESERERETRDKKIVRNNKEVKQGQRL
jgi:hypothetical protein